MNQLALNLLSATRNLHVSVPMFAALACELGIVWMPTHAEQWRATQKILITYGVIAAANTGPVASKSVTMTMTETPAAPTAAIKPPTT